MIEQTKNTDPIEVDEQTAPPQNDPFDEVRRVLSSVFPGERVVVWRDADGNFKFENQGA